MHKPPIYHKVTFCRITQRGFEIGILPVLRLQRRCVLTMLLHTLDATLASSYAQAFSENEAVFYHGTDAVVIAIALTINKKADAAELR